MESIPEEYKNYLYKLCYITNNNFAYKYDTNADYDNEMKLYNFVPTYDKWCLGCTNKNAKYKCSDCKSVYFCGRECQKKCWKVHKKHCKRNLFSICMACGNNNISIKCDDCPVKYCSEKCKKEFHITHKEFDCDYFNKTFGKNYLNY